MSSDDSKLKQALNKSLDAKTAGAIPEFNEVWLAAEAHYLASRRRYRRMTAIAASAVLVAIVITLLPPEEQAQLPDLQLVAGIMNSTQWSAPSDALMPVRSVDVYQDIPELMESTELYEGSLL